MHTKLKKYSFSCCWIIALAIIFLSCDSKNDEQMPVKKVVKSFKIEKKQKEAPVSVEANTEVTAADSAESNVEASNVEPVVGNNTSPVATGDKGMKADTVVDNAVNMPAEQQPESIEPVEKKSDVAADPEIEITDDKLEAVNADNEDDKGYDPTGRIDPFSPLFKPTHETVVKSSDKVLSIRQLRMGKGRLTPLEKLDLSQLKLTGILNMPKAGRSMAMVEETTGKGHVIKKGTYIGVNSGRVIEINVDKVIIEEEVENWMGDIVVRKRELKLQKPLGER